MTELYLTSMEIKNIVQDLAQFINSNMELQRKSGSNGFVFICVLDGAFMFYSDLMKRIKGDDVEVLFVKARSYEGKVKKPIFFNGNLRDLENKHIYIVEDIIDSGETIGTIINILDEEPKSIAASISVVSLLARSSTDPYSGIGKVKLVVGKYLDNAGFVWGYGMDYKITQRNTDSIFIEFEDSCVS